MKTVRLLFLLLVFAAVVQAAPIVTENDVIICFPLEGPGMNWQRPEILSITYSNAPLGRHKIIVRRNIQIWEALLQKNRPELGKVIVTMLVERLDFHRLQGIKIRARTDAKVSRWSKIRAVVVRKI